MSINITEIPSGLLLAKQGFDASDFKRKPVGACYVKGSRTIIDSNSLKTAPIAKRLGSRYSRMHAEMATLKDVSRGAGGIMYVYRATKAGSLALARPCFACMKLITQCGITKLCYTTYGGYVWEYI